MRYRRLGRSGFEVSEIGHGLWGMSNWSGSDDTASRQALNASAFLGCNFFDTAWAYGNGKSDRLLGELLRAYPGKRLFAASKVPPKNRKWPASSQDDYREAFPRQHVLDHVDMIRTALGRDVIDLLQFHVWSDAWAADPEFSDTVQELKARGLIHSFGLSLNRWEPENGIQAIRAGVVDVVQVIYNIFDQAPEDELFPACKEFDIGVIARVPLDEGSLAGNLTLDTRFPEGDWRAGYFNPENLRNTVQRVEALRPLLDGMTMTELALRFIISNSVVATSIVGMRAEPHVVENLGFSDEGPLPNELKAALRHHRWDRRPTPWSA